LIAVNMDNMDVCCKQRSDNIAKSASHSNLEMSHDLTIDEMFQNIVVKDAGVKKFLKAMFDELSKICEQLEAR
jgi:hypothetical protein